MSPESRVVLRLTGSMVTVAFDGAWPVDNARGAAALAAGQVRRHGKARSVLVTMRRDDANDLASYFESVASVVGSMTADERCGDRSGKIAERAAYAIREVLADQEPQTEQS